MYTPQYGSIIVYIIVTGIAKWEHFLYFVKLISDNSTCNDHKTGCICFVTETAAAPQLKTGQLPKAFLIPRVDSQCLALPGEIFLQNIVYKR